MENNIYEAPQASLSTSNTNEVELASRWGRLFAAIIDSLIIMCVTLPLMYFTGGFAAFTSGVQPGFVYTLGIGVVGWVVFALINGKSLLSSGQTIGKKALEIKIVQMDGSVPVINTLLTRYAVYFLPNIIPFVGSLFGLVNVLFIFGEEKRCVHDLVAKTKVVKAS